MTITTVGGTNAVVSYKGQTTVGPWFLRAYQGGTPGSPSTASAKSNIVPFQQSGVFNLYIPSP